MRVLNTSFTRCAMRSKFMSWPVFQMLNLRLGGQSGGLLISIRTHLYSARLRSNSSGGFGGVRYPNSEYICSSFAERLAWVIGELSEAGREARKCCSNAARVGSGAEVCLVRQIRRRTAGTVVGSSGADECRDTSCSGREREVVCVEVLLRSLPDE